MNPIPTLHLLMIAISTGLLFMVLILHHLSPDDQLYIGLVATIVGFLFGKFTNGFKRDESVYSGQDTQEKKP